MKLIIKYHYFFTALILFICISIIYIYKVIPSYNYDSDFGRDLNDILQITRGKLTLIGPKLSFGGIHAGPYYYYLFAPILRLFNYQPESMILFNAIIFLLLLGCIFEIILKNKIKNKYTWFFGIFWIYISPFMIFSGRGPGNAFSYMAILLILLICFPYLLDKGKAFWGLIYGFFAGIIINFHLINLLIFFPLIIISFLVYLVKKDTKKIGQLLLICLGIFISFGPLLLFEFRHNFVQLKNTFIDKSYIVFVDNKNLVDPLPTSSNRFLNFWLLQKHFTTWSEIPFLIIFVLTILLLVIKWKKVDNAIRIFAISSIFSYFLLVFIAKSQVAIHYFFPFILSTQVSFLILTKYLSPKISIKLFILFIIIILLSFPKQFYTPAKRSINEYRQFTNKLIKSEIFNNIDPKFNVFCARETSVAILGWEYRYFMDINGYKSQSPIGYNQSNQLLIIQESSNTDNIDSLSSWELTEFGPKSIIKSTNIDGRNIFLYNKKY